MKDKTKDNVIDILKTQIPQNALASVEMSIEIPDYNDFQYDAYHAFIPKIKNSGKIVINYDYIVGDKIDYNIDEANSNDNLETLRAENKALKGELEWHKLKEQSRYKKVIQKIPNEDYVNIILKSYDILYPVMLEHHTLDFRLFRHYLMDEEALLNMNNNIFNDESVMLLTLTFRMKDME